MAHAGARTIGLDGVVAQQDNYRKSGFTLAYNNIRYGGAVLPLAVPAAATVPLSELPFETIARDDATVFPAARPAFLRAWLSAPGHAGRALMRDGRLAAWGVIRPCRGGRKIGPLVADGRAAAEAVFAALLGDADGECFSTCRSRTARPPRSPRRMALRRCFRPRGCIPARSATWRSNGCSA